MLWICLTAWAGLFIWYFRMRKKAEDHKLVRRIFCLAATGFIAGTAPVSYTHLPERSTRRVPELDFSCD